VGKSARRERGGDLTGFRKKFRQVTAGEGTILSKFLKLQSYGKTHSRQCTSERGVEIKREVENSSKWTKTESSA